MKIHLHTYFITFRTILLAYALLFLEWQMSNILFFLAVNLVLELVFMVQKIYFNSDYVPYRSRGGWLLRIFPALGEWLLLCVTLLPPILMLLIVSMAYLDEQMGENLYSLLDYFKKTTQTLLSGTLTLSILSAVSFLVEHIWYIAAKHYQRFIFRNFIRTFLLVYLLLFPAMTLGILALDEIEEIQVIEKSSPLFAWLVLIAKLLADLVLLRWGYWLPSLQHDPLHLPLHQSNTPVSPPPAPPSDPTTP